ncbi:hypothetical protein TruAng_004862 [Truncatella angustata]|nr:hypothetical protein TruAng_004862 [Truncatella angustata]
MQFSSIISLFAAAAASVQALPSEKRQDAARIYARFYSGSGCDGTWVEDTVWLQEPAGTCLDVNIPFGYNSTLFADNLATRTLRVYNTDNCNESGNFYDVPAGNENCYAQHIESVKFL